MYELTTRNQRILITAVMLLCAVVVLLPLQGSLSVTATHWLATTMTAAPGIEVLSDGLLLVLAAATMAALLYSWIRVPARRGAVVGASAGVVLAYGVSEGLKRVLAEPRPCARWSLATECPPAGDWSLPSNHATLAFGAVIVIVVAVGRTWAAGAAVIVAAAVAMGRVAQGVHYLHDVAVGAMLGIVCAVALAWGGSLVSQSRSRLRSRLRSRQAGPRAS